MNSLVAQKLYTIVFNLLFGMELFRASRLLAESHAVSVCFRPIRNGHKHYFPITIVMHEKRRLIQVVCVTL